MEVVSWSFFIKNLVSLASTFAANPIGAALGVMVMIVLGGGVWFWIKSFLKKIEIQAAAELTQKEHEQLVNREVELNRQKNLKDNENMNKLDSL